MGFVVTLEVDSVFQGDVEDLGRCNFGYLASVPLPDFKFFNAECVWESHCKK